MSALLIIGDAFLLFGAGFVFGHGCRFLDRIEDRLLDKLAELRADESEAS